MKDLISSKVAANKLGVSLRRVQALITSGKLPAQKIGNSYVIKEKDLELVRVRIAGRPSKN
ncbi:MAG: helix-turn-helix domain-containing protein [Acidobacteria bacterium]|nr:helix-turn-helix domain-containing protein [Acidobacteriota bacterium]